MMLLKSLVLLTAFCSSPISSAVLRHKRDIDGGLNFGQNDGAFFGGLGKPPEDSYAAAPPPLTPPPQIPPPEVPSSSLQLNPFSQFNLDTNQQQQLQQTLQLIGSGNFGDKLKFASSDNNNNNNGNNNGNNKFGLLNPFHQQHNNPFNLNKINQFWNLGNRNNFLSQFNQNQNPFNSLRGTGIGNFPPGQFQFNRQNFFGGNRFGGLNRFGGFNRFGHHGGLTRFGQKSFGGLNSRFGGLSQLSNFQNGNGLANARFSNQLGGSILNGANGFGSIPAALPSPAGAHFGFGQQGFSGFIHKKR